MFVIYYTHYWERAFICHLHMVDTEHNELAQTGKSSQSILNDVYSTCLLWCWPDHMFNGNKVCSLYKNLVVMTSHFLKQALPSKIYFTLYLLCKGKIWFEVNIEKGLSLHVLHYFHMVVYGWVCNLPYTWCWIWFVSCSGSLSMRGES